MLISVLIKACTSKLTAQSCHAESTSVSKWKSWSYLSFFPVASKRRRARSTAVFSVCADSNRLQRVSAILQVLYQLLHEMFERLCKLLERQLIALQQPIDTRGNVLPRQAVTMPDNLTKEPDPPVLGT